MRFILSLVLLMLVAMEVRATEEDFRARVVPVVQNAESNFVVATQIDNDEASVASFKKMRKSHRSGKSATPIRAAFNDTGLLVSISIPADFDTPDAFAKLRLSSMRELVLPHLGWGTPNWRGALYRTEADCSDDYSAQGFPVQDCITWLKQQPENEAKVATQFVRHWTIARDKSASVQSQPVVFDQSYMDRNGEIFEDVFQTVQTIHANWPAKTTNSRNFIEFSIPWDALPAAGTLNLDAVYLSVGICSGKQSAEIECSSLTSPNKNSDDGFVKINLAPARKYQLTECAYELGWEFWRAFYFPSANPILDRAVVLRWPFTGYQSEPLPTLFVPEWMYFPFLKFGDGSLMCDSEQQKPFQSEIYASEEYGYSEFHHRFIPGFNKRHELDNGDLLLAVVPDGAQYTRTGEGQNGGCPRVGFNIFRVSRATQNVDKIADEFTYLDCGWGSYPVSFRVTLEDDFSQYTTEATIQCYDNALKDCLPEDVHEKIVSVAVPKDTSRFGVKVWRRYCVNDTKDGYSQCDFTLSAADVMDESQLGDSW